MQNVILFSVLAAAMSSPSDSIVRNINLGEVQVVSTVKESSAMRQQPSAVSLLSSQQMEDNHITSLKGVSALVPNFFMPDYGSRLTSAVYIRGIGSRLNTPAVGMYVDNVPYVDKSAFDFNFYDIDRVDVLRGPQGTLYGRNAMGGIVRIYTKNPFHYSGTDVRLGYATRDNHRTASITHYHRFGNHFALSAGGYYEGGDGFFRNSFTDSSADPVQAGGGRVRGVLKANERLSVDFSLNYDYSDEGAYPYFYTGSLSDPAYLADSIGTIGNNRKSNYRRGLLNAGVNIEYRMPKVVLNAITGYQNLNDRMFLDQDFLCKDIYTLEQKQRINTINEEIVMKNAEPGWWEWVSGGNFTYQTLHTTGPVTFYADGLRWLESTINRNMPDVSKIPSLDKMGFKSMSVNFRGDELLMGGAFDTPSFNAAIFHQSTFHLTSQLSATLGLRLDHESMRMEYDAPAVVNYGFTLANPGRPVMHVDLQDLSSVLHYDGKIKDNYLSLLPKASLMYEFNKHSNLYLSLAKGQRSGGYNVQMFSDLLQGAMQNSMMQGIQTGVAQYMQKFTEMGMPPAVIQSVTGTMAENMPVGEDPTVDQVVYKPEYSWNFELGAHLGTTDGALKMDAALFLINTHDQQIARFTPSGFGRMMVNAGKSRSLGGELSILWRSDEHLALTANYGYTHAKFTNYDTGDGHDYTGNCVPFVPRHTLHLDAAYTWRLSDNAIARSLTLAADYRGAGSLYWTEKNDTKQKYYSLLGARLGIDTSFGSVQLWARNLIDTRYNTFYFESASRGFAQHGKPFQLGVDVRFHLQ